MAVVVMVVVRLRWWPCAYSTVNKQLVERVNITFQKHTWGVRAPAAAATIFCSFIIVVPKVVRYCRRRARGCQRCGIAWEVPSRAQTTV